MFFQRPSTFGDACSILNHDYSYLSTMPFEEAYATVHFNPRPDAVSCFSQHEAQMKYTIDGSSIVSDWDLVCDKSVWRTTVQVAVSFGKFVGASLFGIVSDKFGRKTSFTIGSLCYATGSLLTSFSPLYWPFLIGRVLLGLAASGIYYPALTIRKSLLMLNCTSVWNSKCICKLLKTVAHRIDPGWGLHLRFLIPLE